MAPSAVYVEKELDDSFTYGPPDACSRFKEHYKITSPVAVYDIIEPRNCKIKGGPAKLVYMPPADGSRKMVMA